MTTKDPRTGEPRPGPGEPPAFALNEHRSVWDAIPWVVAGTATAQEQALVEAHVPTCPHCRDELAMQTLIHRGMHEAAGETGVMRPAESPEAAAAEAAAEAAKASAGLAQLWARDDEATALAAGARAVASNDTPAASAGAAVPGGAAAALPTGASESTRGPRRPSWTQRWLVMAVAVQAVTICVLGLRPPQPQPAPDYVTLSQPTALPPSAILRLVPQGQMDMDSLRRLLSQHGLRIVGADDNATSLLLAPLNPDPTPGASAAGLARHLRTEPGIMLVVPVGAGAEAGMGAGAVVTGGATGAAAGVAADVASGAAEGAKTQ